MFSESQTFYLREGNSRILWFIRDRTLFFGHSGVCPTCEKLPAGWPLLIILLTAIPEPYIFDIYSMYEYYSMYAVYSD